MKQKKLKNKVLKRRRSRLARAVRKGGGVLARLTAGIDEAKRLGLDAWEALTVAVQPAKGAKRW